MFTTIKTFLFDLDGTLYRGSKAVVGAEKVLSALRQAGKRCLFISNNSTHTLDELASKLLSMGIPACPQAFITPLGIAGDFIKQRFGLCRVFVLGVDALSRQIQAYGHHMACENEACDIVLVGRDLEISYRKLETAGAFLQKGAKLIACNTDLTHPGEKGYMVPETGAFLSALQCIYPCPYLDIGKPSPFLFQYVSDLAHCVMVGDNLLTDIRGGLNVGCKTVLISENGEKGPADLGITDLRQLLSYL